MEVRKPGKPKRKAGGGLVAAAARMANSTTFLSGRKDQKLQDLNEKWKSEPADSDGKQERCLLVPAALFLLCGHTISQKMAEASWHHGTNINHRRPRDALFLCHDAAAVHCTQLTKLPQNCLCSPEIWPQTRCPDLFQISLPCQERLKMEKNNWSE